MNNIYMLSLKNPLDFQAPTELPFGNPIELPQIDKFDDAIIIDNNNVNNIFGKLNVNPGVDIIVNPNLKPFEFPKLNSHQIGVPQSALNGSTEFYVSYSNRKKKWKFFDSNNHFLGSFTIQDIISYINNITGNRLDNNSIIMIEQFLCKRKISSGNNIDIQLLDYKESALMGDIELLLRLSSELNNCIGDSINLFNMKLLNYILKLISQKWQDICTDNGDNKSKYTSFAINIINKIYNHIMVNIRKLQNNIIQNNKLLTTNNNLRLSLNKKISEIINNVSLINNKNGSINSNNSESQNEESCMLSFSETKESSSQDASNSTIYSISSGTDDCGAIYDA